MVRFGMFAFGLGLALAAPQGAQAAVGNGLAVPGTASAGPAIVQVMDGCGPGGHRNGYGECRPNRPPPGYYRRCPPYSHPTPYGCRRNY